MAAFYGLYIASLAWLVKDMDWKTLSSYPTCSPDSGMPMGALPFPSATCQPGPWMHTWHAHCHNSSMSLSGLWLCSRVPICLVPASHQIQDLPLSWRWPNQFLPQLQPWLPNPLSCELKTTPQSRRGCWPLSSFMSSSTGSLELKIHFPKKQYYNSESESPFELQYC